MNIEGFKKQEMRVINAANLELSATSSQTVECTRQHNEWEKSAMLCASSMQNASLTLRKTRSFSSIPQCQDECGNYVHSKLSRSESQLNNWLAKIDITTENGGEVPNVIECVKGAPNLEQLCTSGTAHLHWMWNASNNSASPRSPPWKRKIWQKVRWNLDSLKSQT